MMRTSCFDAKIVGELRSVTNPGMITSDEERLYVDTARAGFRRDRIVLEIGPWLGRSTQRICDGLDQASDEWFLDCFDQFRWRAAHRPRALGRGVDDLILALRDGDSFEPVFRQLMGARSKRIRTFSGRVSNIKSILSEAWPVSQPVGLLFVDASKGWENARLFRFLANRLIPGEAGSRLLFQDFLFFPAYKLIFLTMLLPFLQLSKYVSTGSAVTLSITDTPSADHEILAEGAMKRLTEPQIRHAWERLVDSLPPARLNAKGLELALPLMLWSCGHRQAAEKEFGEAKVDERDFQFVRARVNRNSEFDRIGALRELVGSPRS